MTLEIKRRASMVLASIVAVVFAMTALLAGAAQAEEEGPQAPPPGPGNIQKPAGGASLTVHKHAEPNLGVHADGNALDNAPDNPLKRVEFSIYKIDDLDVTDRDDWDTITGLDNGKIVVDEDAGTVTVDGLTTKIKGGPEETGVDGVVSFTGLDLGVYVVVEGKDNGKNKITAKAAPFIVTLPTPSPVKGDTSGKRYWNYDVHAYPKNSVTDVTKTVNDTDAVKAGDLVTWTVEAKIPQGDDLVNFHVSDTFDSRLTPKKVEAALAKVTTSGFDTTHYTVEHADGSQTVKVVFTPAGVAKLNAMKGDKIKVEFYTEVNSLGTDGVIPNQATVFVDDPEENGDGFPSDEPKTKWGELKITKSDEDNAKLLSGAEFKVYTENPDENPAATSVATLVTDENGVASVILKKGTYYVKETKAPAGYVLDPVVKTVKIDPDVDELFKVNLKLDNKKSDVPDLPLTGASGQLLMMVGGGAVILLAAGTGLVAIKRRRA